MHPGFGFLPCSSLEAGNSPQDIVHCQHSLLYISHRAKEDRVIVLCNPYLETSEIRRWDPLGELFRDNCWDILSTLLFFDFQKPKTQETLITTLASLPSSNKKLGILLFWSYHWREVVQLSPELTKPIKKPDCLFKSTRNVQSAEPHRCATLSTPERASALLI